MNKKIKQKLLCYLKGHDWTCKANEGIDPTPEELANPHVGFWLYSQMFCKRCGKESKIMTSGEYDD